MKGKDVGQSGNLCYHIFILEIMTNVIGDATAFTKDSYSESVQCLVSPE
jgi:hypothetical protein